MRCAWRAGAVLVLISGLAAQSRPGARPDEFFARPEALCGALENQGIHTGPWKPIGAGPHSANVPFDCEYSVRGLVYRVSGDNKARADIISVAVTVGNPNDWSAAQQQFSELVAGIFKFIGKPEPAGLVRAIQARRYYLARRSYGNVWFNFVAPMQRSAQRTFWFRLSK